MSRTPPRDAESRRRPVRRLLFASAAFLIGFGALLMLILHGWLLPASQAWVRADAAGRARLSAYSTLLLAVTLILLGMGLWLAFRVGRRIGRGERD